jgi:hypothetical protein
MRGVRLDLAELEADGVAMPLCFGMCFDGEE